MGWGREALPASEKDADPLLLPQIETQVATLWHEVLVGRDNTIVAYYQGYYFITLLEEETRRWPGYTERKVEFCFPPVARVAHSQISHL